MDVKRILDRAATLKIAVIGDLIVDHYIYGTVDRISPEAPVPVVKVTDKRTTLGGAGNVFMNLLNLGVDVELFCNYNNPDKVKFWDHGDSLSNRIHCNLYPHSKKTRVVCGNQQMIRVDEELDTTANDWQWQAFKHMSWWEYLMNKSSEYDAFVISDYGKGVVSDSVINTLIDYQFINRENGKHSPVIVDAKRRFDRFRGAYCVKANDKEVTDDTIHACVNAYQNNIFIKTLGEHGIEWYTDRTHLMEKKDTIVKGIPVNIVDVCGAGDTVTAALAICLSSAREEVVDIKQACEFANMAAAEVCKHPGVYPIRKEDIEHMIIPIVDYEE